MNYSAGHALAADVAAGVVAVVAAVNVDNTVATLTGRYFVAAAVANGGGVGFDYLMIATDLA